MSGAAQGRDEEYMYGKTHHVGSRLSMVSLLKLAILGAAGLEVGGERTLDRRGRHLVYISVKRVWGLCWFGSRKQDQAICCEKFCAVANGEARWLRHEEGSRLYCMLRGKWQRGDGFQTKISASMRYDGWKQASRRRNEGSKVYGPS